MWKEHKTDAGKVYFYNTETKVSVWEEPEELTKVKRQIAEYDAMVCPAGNLLFPLPHFH